VSNDATRRPQGTTNTEHGPHAEQIMPGASALWQTWPSLPALLAKTAFLPPCLHQTADQAVARSCGPIRFCLRFC
jgi:hypothetical protein